MSESKQNSNAGNAGDLLKHSGYLALLHELIEHPTWSQELRIIEAHSGKGVYAAKSSNLRDARSLSGYAVSPLGAAQATAFAEPPTGLGPLAGLGGDEIPYAGSAVIHALELRKLPRRALTLMDHDASVRNTVALVFREPALVPLAPDLQLIDPGTLSELTVLRALERDDYSQNDILHFDPFAFLMDQAAQTRSTYKRLVTRCNEQVHRGKLAGATLFLTWGSNNRAALDDLVGSGYGGGLDGGYRDLLATVEPSQRIVLTWCWTYHFAMLLIVPMELRTAIASRLHKYVEVFRPKLRTRLTVE
ncbi:MAG: hypothetical protein QM820_63675 [Minicystis sp.]